MNNDERLAQLDRVEQESVRLKHRSTWIATSAVLGAALIVGLLLYTVTRQLGTAYVELQVVQTKIDDLDEQLLLRQAEVQRAESELQAKQALLRSLEKHVSERELLAAEQEVQLSQPAPPPPSGQILRSRAYLQIVDNGDRNFVESVAAKLRQADFIVPGIEYVPAAKQLRGTVVRYYKKADRPEAVRLVATLQQAGVTTVDPEPQYLARYENSQAVRPNHLEVWFASQR